MTMICRWRRCWRDLLANLTGQPSAGDDHHNNGDLDGDGDDLDVVDDDVHCSGIQLV